MNFDWVQLAADFGFPESPGRHPALVLAPGVGYHKDLPLIRLLWQKAIRRGCAAVRFDWGFFTEKGAPSEGFRAEEEELALVLEAVRREPSVDPGALFLVGKSLGSILVHRLAQAEGVRATFLLTPIVREPGDLERHYPGLHASRKPAILVAGDSDENCPLPLLYEELKGANQNLKLLVVGGDHSLRVGNGVQTRQNLEAACRMVLYWVKLLA